MSYKTSLDAKLSSKVNHIRNRFGKNVTIILSSSNRKALYSDEEIQLIIQLKKQKNTDQFIANKIGRTYWSTVYKIKELRKQGLL